MNNNEETTFMKELVLSINNRFIVALNYDTKFLNPFIFLNKLEIIWL